MVTCVQNTDIGQMWHKGTWSSNETHQEDNGNPTEPVMAHWLPLTLCTSFLYWAASWAVTQEEGQGIVGTHSVTVAPATSEKKKAPSREQRDKLRKSTIVDGWGGAGGQPGRKPENNEGVDVTPLVGWQRWVGTRKKKKKKKNKKTWLHWNQSWKVIDKKQGPVPTATFPMPPLVLYIYTSVVGPFPLRDCLPNVYAPLSLWTCIGCYFELDPCFI